MTYRHFLLNLPFSLTIPATSHTQTRFDLLPSPNMHLKPVALMAVLAAHTAATWTKTTNERMSAAYDYAANESSGSPPPGNEYSLDGASAVMKADMEKGTCYIDFNIPGVGCTGQSTVMKYGCLTEWHICQAPGNPRPEIWYLLFCFLLSDVIFMLFMFTPHLHAYGTLFYLC